MAPRSFTLVQVSDMHLDPADADALARFAEVRRQIAAAGPDLIVVTGDATADGYRHDGMFERVRAQLAGWPCPVHVIPGNHDVGGLGGGADAVQSRSLSRWNDAFGSDRFAVTRDGWVLVGLNTQLVGSALAEETEQQRWLVETLDAAERDAVHAAVFLHTPPFLAAPDESLTEDRRFWVLDAAARTDLLAQLHRAHVRLVAHGHLHWYSSAQRGGALWIGCPSTYVILDDVLFRRGGDRVGFIRYEFTGRDVEPHIVEVDGPTRVHYVKRPTLELPGREPITMAELTLDFTGTLAADGRLLPGIAARLIELSQRIRVTVLTADTFGTAREALEGLPVEFRPVETGADKERHVQRLGAEHVVAIGNGRNDVEMVRSAAVGIAVVGPEGGAGELVRVADVVVRDIGDALDLVANPLRLKATLRD